MSRSGEGSIALLPEPFEVRPGDVDKAARAAREAAAQIAGSRRDGRRRRGAPPPEPDPTAEDDARAT